MVTWNEKNSKGQQKKLTQYKNVKKVGTRLKVYSDEELFQHQKMALKRKLTGVKRRTIRMDVHPCAPKFSEKEKK